MLAFCVTDVCLLIDTKLFQLNLDGRSADTTYRVLEYVNQFTKYLNETLNLKNNKIETKVTIYLEFKDKKRKKIILSIYLTAMEMIRKHM